MVVCVCRVNHAVSWKLMKPHMQVNCCCCIEVLFDNVDMTSSMDEWSACRIRKHCHV